MSSMRQRSVGAPKGFRVYDVPGDGNCFYAALSLALSDFRSMWGSEDVSFFKGKLLRRLWFYMRETEGEDLSELDTDLQVLFQDRRLPRRLAINFSWAETSEIILASFFVRRIVHVWVLYPDSEDSLLALVTDPPGWSLEEPLHIWNVVTRDGEGDHFYALQPVHVPHEVEEPSSDGLILSLALSFACLSGLTRAFSRSQRGDESALLRSCKYEHAASNSLRNHVHRTHASFRSQMSRWTPRFHNTGK